MSDPLTQLAQRLSGAMLIDRHRLSRRLDALRKDRRDGRRCDKNLGRLTRQLGRSVALREKRLAALPRPTLVADLPITQRADEIAKAIEAHQVVVVAGETGSGKSTQLPKLLLKMGRGVAGLIGHTQPRRIAARSVAARVSEELGSTLGSAVGYKVRFNDKTSPTTYIKLMTDGVLLAEAARDRFFEQYDTLIIDEAHERSLNIDFILGHLKQILPKRPDLRVVITSATIDTQRFAEHFADVKTGELAPVIEVSGRTYPVEVRYRPPLVDEETGEAEDVGDALCRAVDELSRDPGDAQPGGDVLVFMPTERDIREACDALEHHLSRGRRAAEVLPLFGRLSNAEQDRIFSPKAGGPRRVIVATNVAESSLTVPGIHYVIDTGTARVSRYSPNSKVQRLPIEPVSQASADQRKGRCGRLGPGVCIRLFSAEDFAAREAFSTPEILRTSLAAVILQITSLRFGAVERFPFIDPPRGSMIRDGYKTLHELGALDVGQAGSPAMTPIGRSLSRMPVDPRVGRMVLAGKDEGVLEEVLVVAAALEVQDPRERPAEKRGAADTAHEKFTDPRSDFLLYLNLWRFYHQQRRKLSHSKLRKCCSQNFLNYMRMREWIDVHQQLARLAKDVGLIDKAPRGEELPEEISDSTSDAIHRALLAGLLSNIAQKGDGYDYQGAGGQTLHLWPGSALFKAKPKWVVASELVETTRRYARTVGRVQPGMIEPLAHHLVKLTHSEPRWVRETGSVMCSERVSLYGLTLIAARPVPLGKVNPAEARQMFIQHALVEEDWEPPEVKPRRNEQRIAGGLRTPVMERQDPRQRPASVGRRLGAHRGGKPSADLFAFVHHNRALVAEVRAMEHKSRRHGLLVSDDRRFTFYDERLPGDVFDAAGLKQWLKREGDRAVVALTMSRGDLLAPEARERDITPERYPDRLAVDRSDYRLDYRYAPGDDDDGVTLTLPREGLASLDPRRVGWLVPGLLEEKLVALIKSLPKGLRKPLSPAPDAARRALQSMTFGQEAFEAQAARALSGVAGLAIRPEDFDASKLPEHLAMRLRVLDKDGNEVAVGRDVAAVRRACGAGAVQAYLGMDLERWSAPGETTWAFGELPKHVDLTRSGVAAKGFPALIDEGETVALRLVDQRGKARRLTRIGLRRLFTFEVQRELRWRVDQWPGIEDQRLWFSPYGRPKALREQLVARVVERAFLFDHAKITDAEGFITRQRVGFQRLDAAVEEVHRVAGPVLQSAHVARLALERSKLPADHYARADVRIQLDNLLGAGFLTDTPWDRLRSYPRYLSAVVKRLEKLGTGGPSGGGPAARDLAGFREVAPLWNRYAQQQTTNREHGRLDPELDRLRWMIEELRVSLFAQELGTAEKVSVSRLEQQWAKVGAGS
ncbi:MAG: ATP-dependent RNA helicase HrpA [Planctomycetota bacterium]